MDLVPTDGLTPLLCNKYLNLTSLNIILSNGILATIFFLIDCDVIVFTAGSDQNNSVSEQLCFRTTLFQNNSVSEQLCFRTTLFQNNSVSEQLCFRTIESQYKLRLQSSLVKYSNSYYGRACKHKNQCVKVHNQLVLIRTCLLA